MMMKDKTDLKEKMKRLPIYIGLFALLSILVVSASSDLFNPIVPPPHGLIPPPTYDSGWVGYAQGEEKVLNHNLGTQNLLIQNTAQEEITSYNNSDAEGFWKLDEGFGTNVTDYSDTDYWGLTTNMDNSNWIAGKCNSALFFNSTTGQNVDFDDVMFFSRWDDFSLEAWIKTNTTATQVIVAKEQSSGDRRGYMFFVAGGELHSVVVNSVTSNNRIQVRTDGASPDDGDWHHVVMTYDGSSTAAGVGFYFDGSPTSTVTIYDTLTGSSSTSEDFNIGCRGSDGSELNYFNGTIDEVVVYDYVLPQAKVTQRYNGGTGLCGGLEPPVTTNYTNMKYSGDVLSGYYVEAITNNTITIGRGVASDYASNIRTRIWKW